VIEAALPLARACAESLEIPLAGPYLTGETFGLADIRLMPHFAWLPATIEGRDILTGKDQLRDWF